MSLFKLLNKKDWAKELVILITNIGTLTLGVLNKQMHSFS
jgi:hypothetical protein